MTRRRWIALLVATTIVATGVVLGYVQKGSEPCGAEKVATTNPLLSVAEMAEQPDERLDVLARTVDAMDGPFGDVEAGVGYDYDQWLRLYGVHGGLLSWTKNNAPVTYLRASDLEPRWSLRPARKRVAWDADTQQFFLLGLAKGKPTQLSAYDLADGTERWCTELPMAQADGEPVSTALIADGADLIVALPGSGSAIRATRVSSADGGTSWNRQLRGVDRADFLGMLPDDLFVAGGSEEHRLAGSLRGLPAGPVVSAFSIADGRRAWGWAVPAGAIAHVVGLVDSLVIVIVRSASGSEMVSLDHRGREVWRRELPAFTFQSTLRSGVVMTRTLFGISAYDARTGELTWGRKVPTESTYFPYGFTLDQMPSLDETHVLMPTTTALRVLDVKTGKDVAYPLPTDGVSTTYWPYQLAVTEDLIGIVTNTGGVVVHRQ